MRQMLGVGSKENLRRAGPTRKKGMVKTTLTWDAKIRKQQVEMWSG